MHATCDDLMKPKINADNCLCTLTLHINTEQHARDEAMTRNTPPGG